MPTLDCSFTLVSILQRHIMLFFTRAHGMFFLCCASLNPRLPLSVSINPQRACILFCQCVCVSTFILKPRERYKQHQCNKGLKIMWQILLKHPSLRARTVAGHFASPNPLIGRVHVCAYPFCTCMCPMAMGPALAL